ncbi:MAG: response regulator [Alphaproteobacteria bacterium]|nr:response regulator [Alphaproteobacteria bacterium]
MRRRLGLLLLGIVAISTLLVGGGVAYVARTNLNASAEQRLAAVQTQLRDKFHTLDVLISEEENLLNQRLQTVMPQLAEELLPWEGNQQAIPVETLNALSLKYGADHIYLIDRNGVILNSNFKPDVGLDLKSISEGLWKLLNSIYGQGKVVSDRYSVSIKTGIFRKYAYFSPVGKSYIVEVSHDLLPHLKRARSERFVEFLFRDMFNLTASEGDGIREIDILIANKQGTWSLLEPGRSLESAISKALLASADGKLRRQKGNLIEVYERSDRVDENHGPTETIVTKVVYDISDIQALSIKFAWTVGLFSIVCALAAFALAAWYLEKAMINPIMGITGRLQGIADGLYSRLPTKGFAELAHISDTINLMQDRIVAREKEARTLAQNLEQLVEDRTAEMRDAMTAAKNANRAKSDFLATMSHEIRTPLNGILGMSHLLLQSPLSKEQKAQMEMLNSSAKGLLTILDDILDLTKLEAGRLEFETIPFHLPSLCQDVSGLFEASAKSKGLTLDTILDKGVPEWVAGDPVRLRQLLMNLTGNAVKFTESGSIKIHVGATKIESDKACLEFSIQDTGIGMDEAAKAKLFQPFTQADSSIARRYGGSGLGLIICKRLIEAQNGQIGVESEPGQGSRFWFSLHFQLARPQESLPVAEAHATQPALKILLAEDNPINQRVALGLLAAGGHQAEVAFNGREAIELAMNKNFDLILMDIQMPEIDGLEATRTIRRLPAPLGQIPIIALTANAMPSDVERYMAAGFTAHVAKPIEPDELANSLAFSMSKAKDAAPVAQDKPDTLATLSKYLGTNAIVELGELFLSTGTRDCQALRNLAHEGPLSDIRYYAHDLKGMAAYIGASELSDLTMRIELAANEGREAEARELIQDMPDAWIAAVVRLDDLMETGRQS